MSALEGAFLGVSMDEKTNRNTGLTRQDTEGGEGKVLNTLVLVDGHALAYRMYFALEMTRMSTSKKEPTWAIYGFFNALFAMLREIKPDGVLVAFDAGKETFRNKIYAEYKAHREEMPDALRAQMSAIVDGVEAFGFPMYQVPDVEADDVIGSIAHRAMQDPAIGQVLILTGDQDAFQLVDEAGKVQILIPSRKPKEGLVWYNWQKVIEKWGVTPAQVIDYKALRGDTSDNIPGVPGIGEKTASKLLNTYPTLEAIYEDLTNVTPAGVQKKLTENREQAFLSQTLATIKLDVTLDFEPERCRLSIDDPDRLINFFQTWEFKQFLQQAATLFKDFSIGGSVGENGLQDEFLETPDAEQGTPELPRKTASDEGGGTRIVGSNGQISLGLPGTHPPLDSPIKTTDNTGVLDRVFQQKLAEAAPKTVQDLPHRVIQTVEDWQAYLATLKTTGVFALDLETTGLDVFTVDAVGIALSVSPGRFGTRQVNATNVLNLDEYPKQFRYVTLENADAPIDTVYVPVGHTALADGERQLDTAQVLQDLRPLLENPDNIVFFHNAKYECNVFRQWGIDVQAQVWDTLIGSYVLQPERRHGLKSLALNELNIQLDEITQLIGTGKKQITFDQVPLEKAAPYAASDAYCTLLLASQFIPAMEILSKETPASSVSQASLASLFYEVELPLTRVLAQMEWAGISLDLDHMKSLSLQLDEKLTVLEKEITDLAGESFNLNSTQQVGYILFEKLGISPLRKTAKKTAYSTDAKVLEQLADEHEIVGKLLSYRQYFKLKSTYIDALPQMIHPKTHRIHTSFNQAVAATGRLSSSDPNLQNIPIRTDVGRSIRQAFVPRPPHQLRGATQQAAPDIKRSETWKLVSADYSQIELRLLAHFSNDPHLVEAFRSGQDIHTATAALVFGLKPENITKEQRYQAKAVNFGIIYGQTAHGLSQQLKITRAEAQVFIDRYFATYPKVHACIEAIKEQAHQQGFVHTLAGRMRHVKEGLNSSVRTIREFTERAAFNTPLQGSASDLMKVAMIRLRDRLQREQVQSQIILQVHDELVLEVPESELEQVTPWIEEAMTLGQPLNVPLVVDLHIGPTWMET